MILCKKYIIPTTFGLILSLTGWAEAPVVDDSERFAFTDGRQLVPEGRQKYEEPLVKERHSRSYEQDAYGAEEGPALAQEDNSSYEAKDNASLIAKVQSLQRNIEELRGQLEVQAHEFKLLKEQQLAFYKDLDSRIGSANGKTAVLQPNNPAPLPAQPAKINPVPTTSTSVKANQQITTPINVSRANPADEQISYMAAYELVNNKQYDDAISAMQLFVTKYPKGGYTSNAEYWLGELYLTKREYSKSIEHFQRVLNEFASSSKSPPSMLKLGYAYAALGENAEATKYLQLVLRTYPNTPSAKLANSKLESIKAL